MDKIDFDEAKAKARKAKALAERGAKEAYELAQTTRKSKAVNFLLPSDHNKVRRGNVVETPIDIEKALQRQRLLQMGIIAPMMIYPLVKSNVGRGFKWTLAFAGVILAYSAYQQYDDTRSSV